MEIKVTSEKTYKGQKETWTELCTGEMILSEDTLCVHKTHKKIKSFQAGVITCCYDKNDSEGQLGSMSYRQAKNLNLIWDRTHIVRKDIDPEYVYTFLLPKGTRVRVYGNEYRFQMNSEVKCNLVGIMGTVRVSCMNLFPYETSVYGGKTINVFTKKY